MRVPTTFKVKRTLFAACVDCNTKTYSAEDFSDHVHECKVNPIKWKPTADYLESRAGAN